MPLINDLVRLVSRMPPEGLAILTSLIRNILDSDDPMRAAKRASAAAAASQASEQILKRVLKSLGQ